MMHGRGKSDPAIRAVKLANKAEPSAAELVEQRAGTKGNASQQSTCRAQNRESVSQALDRIRQEASDRRAVTHPRWEPYVGGPAGRFVQAPPYTCRPLASVVVWVGVLFRRAPVRSKKTGPTGSLPSHGPLNES